MVDYRYRAISPFRLPKDLNGGPRADETDRRPGPQRFPHSGYCGRGCPHPHVHCVVPAGGFDPSYSRWVHPKYPFFLPVKVLSRVFRSKFLDLLQLEPAQLRPDLSSTLVHKLLQHDWVVYAKPAFGGPTHVLRYLGRYTHRVAISNQRLLSFDGHSVSFRWKDYAHGNK